MSQRTTKCNGCQQDIWKVVPHPITGDRIELWPRKDSLYVQLWTPTGFAVGLGYCRACCPPFGAPGPAPLGHVIGHETALGRYQRWYTERFGEYLRAWLRDGNSPGPFFDDVQIAAIMQEWEQERT